MPRSASTDRSRERGEEDPKPRIRTRHHSPQSFPSSRRGLAHHLTHRSREGRKAGTKSRRNIPGFRPGLRGLPAPLSICSSRTRACPLWATSEALLSAGLVGGVAIGRHCASRQREPQHVVNGNRRWPCSQSQGSRDGDSIYHLVGGSSGYLRRRR